MVKPTDKKTKELIYYVAHPYTGDNQKNFQKVNDICNNLLDHGLIIFSPISMNHTLHQLKPRTNFWYEYDLKLLNICDVIILCDDWKNSKGCMIEYKKAIELKLPILIFSNGVLRDYHRWTGLIHENYRNNK